MARRFTQKESTSSSSCVHWLVFREVMVGRQRWQRRVEGFPSTEQEWKTRTQRVNYNSHGASKVMRHGCCSPPSKFIASTSARHSEKQPVIPDKHGRHFEAHNAPPRVRFVVNFQSDKYDDGCPLVRDAIDTRAGQIEVQTTTTCRIERRPCCEQEIGEIAKRSACAALRSLC